MSSERVLLRRGVYADSVTLLQVSRQVGQAPGVQAAMVGMATELNLELLSGMGFDRSGRLPVRAVHRRPGRRPAVRRRRHRVGRPAAQRSAAGFGRGRYRTATAHHRFGVAGHRRRAGADLGARAARLRRGDGCPGRRLRRAGVLRQCLRRGRDPAQGRRGRAWPAGDGSGLRHRRGRRSWPRLLPHRGPRPGRAGGRAGTGAQQLLCLLDAAGVGVSAALGVGGRDLSEPVAGRSTLAALRRVGRRPRYRADPGGVQAAGRAGRRPDPARPPPSWPRRCRSRCSGRASRTSPRPPRRC